MSNSNLTDRQYLLLSQFAYVKIKKNPLEANECKGMTLEYIINNVILVRPKGKTIKAEDTMEGPDGKVIDMTDGKIIDNNGCTRYGEFITLLQQIAADPVLGSLRLKQDGYVNKDGEGGFVGYAFTDGTMDDKNANTYFVFTGSEGLAAEPGNKEGMDMLESEDWINNFRTGLNNTSCQFEDAADFVKSLKGEGGNYITGHSQGAANAIYAAATVDGLKGRVFDGTGIGQMLRPDQIGRLRNNPDFENLVNEKDVVGATFFHYEKRRFVEFQPVYKRDVYGEIEKKKDANGNLMLDIFGNEIPVEEKSPFAGHYLQAIKIDDTTGEAVHAPRTGLTMEVEKFTQFFYAYNTIFGSGLKEGFNAYLDLSEGITGLGTSLEDVRQGITKAVDDNIAAVKAEVSQTLAVSSAKVWQDIQGCRGDAEAIIHGIGAGMEDMADKTGKILDTYAAKLSGDFSRILIGYNKLGEGGEIAGTIHRIVEGIENGNGVEAADLFEGISSVASFVRGLNTVSIGIEDLRKDFMEGCTEIINAAMGEAMDTLSNITDELMGMEVKSDRIKAAITAGKDKINSSISRGFDNILDRLKAEAKENFSKIKSNIDKIASGLEYAYLCKLKLPMDRMVVLSYLGGKLFNPMEAFISKYRLVNSEQVSNTLYTGSNPVKVRLNTMEGEGKVLEGMSRRVGEIEDRLASIRSSLPYDIRNRQGVDGQLRELCNTIDELGQTLRKAGRFLVDAAKQYEDAERKLVSSLN